MRRILVTYLLCLLGWSAAAHAEGGCPPGQVPQQGQGWMSCIPLPGSATVYTDDFVGPKKEARWMAIAGDPAKGIIGESAESRTEAEAQTTALQDCNRQGGANCKVISSVKNGCISMATSSAIFGAAGGRTEREAEQAAIDVCHKGSDPICRPIYLKCVKPALI